MRHVVTRVLCTLATMLASLPFALAQAVPVGPDFLVGGDPDLSHQPRAAIDSERWFVVAYVTYFSGTPEGCGFSDGGDRQGCQVLDDFGMNFWSQRPVDIAEIGVDDFMVVWETNPYDPHSEPTFIRGRRLSARAILLSDPFEVAGGELDHPREPRVAALPSSRVIVAWVADTSVGTDDSGTSIQARIFTTAGSPLGPPFQVNTTVLGDQTMPDVAAAPDGRFVVAWESDSSAGSDGSGTSIQLRRFDAAGDPIGADEQVNTYVSADQRNARLACAGDGGFVVVWDSDGSSGSDSSSLSIQARVFGADGAPVGPGFQVNSHVDGTQYEPAVGVMGDGSFEVVWANDDSFESIERQAYDADGNPLGGESQVNTTTDFSPSDPDIAMTSEGDCVVVWDQHMGLRGRIFRQQLLADGFESGDTSAWSATVP